MRDLGNQQQKLEALCLSYVAWWRHDMETLSSLLALFSRRLTPGLI